MTPQFLIWQAIGCPDTPGDLKLVEEGLCAFCGEHQGRIRSADTFGSAFTNTDRLLNPSSSVVCQYCYTALREPTLRSSSWIISPSGVHYFKREDTSLVLFGAKDAPFILYVTTSFKKIGQAKVKLNFDVNDFVLQFEEIPVRFVPRDLEKAWESMRIFYSIPKSEEEKAQPKSFFTKKEILTGDFHYQRISAFGIDRWREIDREIAPLRNGAVLDLLLYALNQEKLGYERQK